MNSLSSADMAERVRGAKSIRKSVRRENKRELPPNVGADEYYR